MYNTLFNAGGFKVKAKYNGPIIKWAYTISLFNMVYLYVRKIGKRSPRFSIGHYTKTKFGKQGNNLFTMFIW